MLVSTIGMRCVYLILFVLLQILIAGKAVKQPDNWQLDQLELQGKRADNGGYT